MVQLGDHLNKLFRWNDTLHNMVIEDAVDQSCCYLVGGLIRTAVQKSYGVIFITFELVVDRLKQTSPWNNSRVAIIDGAQSLHSSSDPFTSLNLNKLYTNIVTKHNELLNSGCTKVVVLIDSINSLHGVSEPSAVFPFVQRISALVSGNLVLVLHGDVAITDNLSEFHTLKKQLDYFCGTYTTLSNYTRRFTMDRDYIDDVPYLEFFDGVNRTDAYLVDLVHQQSSGAVAREFALVKIILESEECLFEFSPYTDPSAESEVTNSSTGDQFKSDSQVNALASGLSEVSFNLHLTDKQKEARENLVLPYLAGATSTATSTIHYHPDDGDDFDEDDPDDDLEV